MGIRRRRLLQSVGAGITASLMGSRGAAVETDRVFVHPETGPLDGVLDLIGDVGGETVLEYENFPFVVAEIPSGSRDDLLADARISFIEDDDDAGIPSGWSPSIPDLLDPGGDSDCSLHPDQEPSWGWERIGTDAVDTDGSDVSVGVLDTGIETSHCSLSVEGGRNFTDSVENDDYEDRHGHGTHVAGVVGALDNDLGVVGVAPETDLYSVKVLDDDGSGRYSDVIAGIDWCLSNDIEIISMSLGGDSRSSTMDQAISDAYAAGHLLLCSAGNEGNNGDGSCSEETMSYPATHEDVLAVTAMDEDDSLASYSSVGSAIDLLAPGSVINSTYVDNEYAQVSGTSVAAPFATGVAALIWQTDDESGPGPNDYVRETLTGTAESVLGTCEEGDGLVDARAAVTDGRPTDDGSGEDRGTGLDDDGLFGSVLEGIADVITGVIEWVRSLLR